MLRQKRAAVGRVWLLCRVLDRAGQGWVSVDALSQSLVKGSGSDRGFGQPVLGRRRLRQILGEGQGVFWRRDKHGRVWLFGAARVAATLGVDRLRHRPVQLPLAQLTGTIGQARAAFYAAFHAGRPAERPISRATIAELTGVPPRTQIAYEAATGMRKRRNFTLGAGWGSISAENTAYRYGAAVFRFVDHQGRQGARGRPLCARQLPNSYSTALKTCARGRQRKINQKLADLVNKGAGERAGTVLTKLYFRDARDVVGSIGRSDPAGNDRYWPSMSHRGAGPLAGYGLWHQVSSR